MGNFGDNPTPTRRYLKYNETQSADKLKDIWLEFLHQISVPAEILDLSEQEFEKVKLQNTYLH